MDKELAQLEEWAVNLINDYDALLQQKNPKSSFLKKLGRFSGELVANPEAYGELLDMARSQNMTAHELILSIRRIEENLLSSTGATSRKQLMSDVVHHFYAQRTGGDTLRKLSQADRQQARAALREIFGPWGNIPENLKSWFRSGHLKSDALTGLELEGVRGAGDGQRIIRAGDFNTPKAHDEVGKSVTGTVNATNWSEAVEGIAPQMDLQRSSNLKSWDFFAALRKDLSNLINMPDYDGLESADDLALRRSLFNANPEQVKAVFAKHLSPYRFDGGGLKLHAGLGFIEMEDLKRMVVGLKDNMIGGLVNTIFSGASREAGVKLGEGDFEGAAVEFGKEYAIGAAGEALIKGVGGAVARRMPLTAARFAGGTGGSGGLLAPAMTAWTIYDLADGITEGLTGKGLSTRMGEAVEQDTLDRYERTYGEPYEPTYLTHPDKYPTKADLPQQPAVKPWTTEEINTKTEALGGDPNEKPIIPTITKLEPEEDKPLDLVNEIEYAAKQIVPGLNFIGGGIKLAF